MMVVDIEGYTKRVRYSDHLDAQRRLLAVMQYAFDRARVRRATVLRRQNLGDGALFVLPEGLPEAKVLPALVLGLRHALHRNNEAPGPFGRMRIRVAVNQGLHSSGPLGHVSRAIVTVTDMVDSPDFKAYVKNATSSDLGLAVPDNLYRDVFLDDYPGIAATDFVKLTLNPRYGDPLCWVHTPISGPALDPHAAPADWHGTATPATVAGMGALLLVHHKHKRDKLAAEAALTLGGAHLPDPHHHDDPNHDWAEPTHPESHLSDKPNHPNTSTPHHHPDDHPTTEDHDYDDHDHDDHDDHHNDHDDHHDYDDHDGDHQG